jgi:hypothetical protein
MIKRALALALFAVSVSSAAIVESAPKLGVVALPGAMSSAVMSPLAVGALSVSPALTVVRLSAAPLAAAPLAVAAPALAVAPAAPAPAKAAALPVFAAAQEGPDRAQGEKAAFEASRTWDGFGSARPSSESPAVPARTAVALPAALTEGWGRGSFESVDGGLTVTYKHHAGPLGAPPRVYAGGLALNESFDPLFARSAAPVRPEYFVWMRGHAPTGWTATAAPIDADARDLARMIVVAARENGATKVELALHSFGTLIFQRMIQLRDEPEVAEALSLLSGSRVMMLNATTHYAGSEKRAGREFEQMGTATKQFVGWLDQMDSFAAAWGREADQQQFAGETARRALSDWRATTSAALQTAAGLNPYYAQALGLWLDVWQAAASSAEKASDPSAASAKVIRLMLRQWKSQRDQLMQLASHGAATMMHADLQAPWAAEIDAIRLGFLAALAKDSKDPGWQESLLRRSSDMFRLEFSKADVAVIRKMRISLELIHATGDQLLNWVSAQILFEILGIETPAKAPAAGTVLSDKTGRFRASIVDGDHYYPLKQRDDLARRLDP